MKSWRLDHCCISIQDFGPFLLGRRSHSCSSHIANRLVAIFIVMGMAVFSGSEVSWAKSPSKDPVVSHLEYLGYECDVLEEGIRARHDSKLPVIVQYFRGGIKVQTGFRGTELKKNEISRFTTTNFLSASTRIAHLYWNQDGHLFMDAWMPGLYEKTRFSVFMEAWEEDAQNIRANAKELEPYLIE